jgi:hypothetical protein
MNEPTTGTVAGRILRLRGQRILLDRDLALLYDVPAIALRQQVRRNLDRFPPDFMFQLSDSEIDSLVSQTVIPSRKHLGGFRPMAFTQEGVAMLSSVLRSPKAIRVNIAIMRAFVKLRRSLEIRRDILRKIERLEGAVNLHDTDILEIKRALRSLAEPKDRPSKVRGFTADQ